MPRVSVAQANAMVGVPMAVDRALAGAGAFDEARRCFERAYIIRPRLSTLLSCSNMALKAGDPMAAHALFRVIHQAAETDRRLALTPAEKSVVQRKSFECDAMLRSREHKSNGPQVSWGRFPTVS